MILYHCNLKRKKKIKQTNDAIHDVVATAAAADDDAVVYIQKKICNL